MTMHLMKIRVTEKSKSTKWKSAEHKRKAEELQASWEAVMRKYEPTKTNPTKAKTTPHASSSASKNSGKSLGFTPPRGSSYKSIPSLPDSGGNASLKPSETYTGDKVLGISIVHKSCLQPVFTEEQAKDLANMRR